MKKLSYPQQIAMETLFTGHGPTTFKGKEHNISRAYLVELFLEDAEMPGVNLNYANLHKAWLVGSNLAGSRMIRADLEAADLRRVNLQDCTLINANLTNADLSGANLARAKLQGANLANAQLDDAAQLAQAASLYQVQGLPAEIAAELKQFNSHLFQKPANPADDPANYTRHPPIR